MWAYVIYDSYPISGKPLEIVKRCGGYKTEQDADGAANAEFDIFGDDTRFGYDVIHTKE